MKQIPIHSSNAPPQPGGRDCCDLAPHAGRRSALKAVAGAALVAGGLPAARAGEEGTQQGDWLVEVNDDALKPLQVADIKPGEKPVIAWPFDPAAKALRDGTRLNRIALVRLDPATLDAATAPRAADGVVAYSAFCTHQGCDVSSWVPAEKALMCFCHFSKFAPQQGAAVLGGPAPRPLPALPLKHDAGRLVVAGDFTAAPGKSA